MTRHSQDRGGSPLTQALAAIEHKRRTALALQEGGLLEGRIGARRDYARETRVNTLYEELRLLSKDQLYQRANLPNPRGGPRGRYASYGRQELISMIIARES